MLNPIDIRYFKMAIGQQRIKHESLQDIQAKCPICGDSKHSKSKARLHLYEKNGVTLVNCFNECSCVNKPVWKFLKDYYPNLLDSYRRETFQNNLNIIKNSKDTDESQEIIKDDLLDIPDINSSKSFEKPPILFDLSQYFEKSDRSYEYIKSRGLQWSPELGLIYSGKEALTIDDKFYNIKDFVIIPLWCGNKMYGFYSRSMKEHKFYTYIPDKNSGYKIWNYFNIDKSKSIYVFEGIFDALSAYNVGITNVVACMGAKLPLDKFENCDLIFCLDNDRTGIKNSIEYCKKGYKAIDYHNDYKDMNEMYINNIDIKSEILNNVVSDILGIIKLQRKL